MKYELDAAKSPMWFDLVAVGPRGEEVGRFKSILEMIDSRSIRLRSGVDPATRPDRFEGDGASNTAVLIKVDE